MTSSEDPVIIKQTSQWLALTKPASWSVHNDPGRDLVSFLRGQRAQIGAGGAGAFQVAPIHRLDVGTSGIILFALTQQAAQTFGQMLASGAINKQYTGVTQGIPQPAELGRWGEWKLPISRKAEGRKNPAGLKKDRVEAHTKYCIDSTGGLRALLTLVPVTGRKHQLRRHCAMIGCSLLGDQRYGDKKLAQRLQQDLGFDRLALHAQSLSFRDPWTQAMEHLQAPVPAEFLLLLGKG